MDDCRYCGAEIHPNPVLIAIAAGRLPPPTAEDAGRYPLWVDTWSSPFCLGPQIEIQHEPIT